MSQGFRFASLCVGLFVAMFGILHVHAQTDPIATAGADPFTIDVSPQYPTPYSTVTITPSSTVFDIASASITLTVNGSPFYKGSGGTSIQIPLGAPGSTSKIVLTAVSGGKTYTQRVTLQPADIALVVEPISTIHPFYAGRGLVAPEGRVRLISIPDLRTAAGKALDPSTLVYTWSLGDQVLDGDSGIGKSVLDAVAPQKYRDADVSVTVTTKDGTLQAKASTIISPVDPQTRIYEESPLLGSLFDTALTDSFTMVNAEDTFLGVPYYFSSTPSLNWSVNGTDSGTQPEITVRSNGTGSGTAQLVFTANDASASQTANSTLAVLFGQKKSLGIFGL